MNNADFPLFSLPSLGQFILIQFVDFPQKAVLVPPKEGGSPFSIP
jgi:hypothetical protein